MTRLHLKYVQSYRGYHYFRRGGHPTIPLPGVVGSAEFMEAYQQALMAVAPIALGKSTRSKPGSVSAAIAEYYGSQVFRSLTGGTPAKRRAILEHFRERYGHKQLASLPKEFVVALLDAMPPHTARNWLNAFRHFMRWCEQRKLVRQDPTWGIRLRTPKSDGHHTWTDDEVAQFEAAHPIGTKARLALALGLSTPLSAVATWCVWGRSTSAPAYSPCARQRPGPRSPSQCIHFCGPSLTPRRPATLRCW
jgi:hypothetical protein